MNSYFRRLWRGRADDAPWVRPAFLGLLLATAALYLWNLSASGYANSFYSAAVQAGSQSWKAFFFGSLDAANAITVDKPPAALWPMALSVRLFGLGSWQILVPEVLMGAATVAVLYAAVRRRFGAGAGLLAGAVLALTPVAALMFRFNNPDALLALLMTVAVYCVLRALELDRGAGRWLVWAGTALGFAFLAKTLQAFLILPVLALVYVVCAPGGVARRLGRLGLGGLALLVSAGWWVALVELWPASSRPYVGGSQKNSFLELTFGYNGLGRLNGNETGSVGGGGRGGGPGGGPGGTVLDLPAGMELPGRPGRAGGGGWGEAGLGRMFNEQVGGQISWLLPAALILLVAGLVVTWRAARTDTARSAFLVWGGSLLLTAGVFSFMAGIFHEYYTVAMAPYLAAVVGMGAAVLWEERTRWSASATLAAAVAVTAGWGFVLLGRTSDWLPWLRWTVLVAGALGALGLLFAGRADRRLGLAAAGLGLAAGLAGPFAYTLTTLAEGHRGSIVTAGPAGMRGPGGMRMPGNGRMLALYGPWPGGQGTGQAPAGGQGTGQAPGGGQGGQGGRGPGGGQGAGASRGGGPGGLLDGATVGSAARQKLLADADSYTWVAASVGSQNAASYQLATEKPVMAIGGFNGSDPSPTLARFKQYVAEGRIHYFIASGGGFGGGGAGGGSAIGSWVESTFEKVTVDGATFFDLTRKTRKT
ncbi:glycosyltransferase family 39 protein [Streptomyces sp. NPDC004327]|uniref:glycosyltransferase family 39 protein n=1 Tax=Streptomyces sp. NPDC004327 TaxID=3364699 RepID=UPI0036747237